MSPIEKELVEEIEKSGIRFDERGPLPTFERVFGTEHEKGFARAFCLATLKKEWGFYGFPTFYESQIWKRVRYLALAKYGNRCQCCGAKPATGAVLHVDHIKPKSKYPELSLCLDNLQVLCADCNLGKSNVDETDWRKQ